MGASSRLRLYQYLPFLEAEGITCDPLPLLNERYLEDVYAKRGLNRWNLLRRYGKVLWALLWVARYDGVILEKEVFPFLPPLAEAWLGLLKVPYIVDYDDAIFHNYDLHPNALVRFFLRGKIGYVMRKAAVVVCGNAYLERYAKAAGAGDTVIIPTVIDTDRYRPKGAIRDPGEVSRGPDGAASDSGEVVIGWIGSPSSMKYLSGLSPVLKELIRQYHVKIHIIGGKSGLGLGNGERVLEWTEDSESALLGALDIGIMPLVDSPWEQGKCGYKLIQYMGSGLPVVGSPVGVNEEIITDGVNGFKAISDQEWRDRLGLLVEDAHLRKVMGAKGRKLVLDKYSLNGAARVWLLQLGKLNKREN
jgi:glycosyltransferase involved in cell wall biosynthesis